MVTDFLDELPAPTDAEVELVQTIASLTTRNSCPSLRDLARPYGITRQAMHKKVRALRAKGLVEERDPGERAWGTVLTHNGKLLAATGAG